MRLGTGEWLSRVLLCAFSLASLTAPSEAQAAPPKIDLGSIAFPQLTAHAITVPDIPWTPPTPRDDAKTPFAPKFLRGHNIFQGEKEYWLADAVAATQGGWPVKFDDPAIHHYLTLVAQNLGRFSNEPEKRYRIEVVNIPAANAFTAGAGKIYISRAMLCQLASEDELAGVIAHEIGHDNFHHAGRTATRQIFWAAGIQKVDSYAETPAALKKLLDAYDPEHNPFPAIGEAMLGIARADEQSADKAAFYIMYKAGYNPLALAEYFERTPDPTTAYLKSEARTLWPVFWTLSLLFDSHPPNGVRVAALRWESNFVGSIPKNAHSEHAAFRAMKNRLKYLDEIDEERLREAREKPRRAATIPRNGVQALKPAGDGVTRDARRTRVDHCKVKRLG
jgi:predicted Zn-dependent protease